jgi:preprotein translocase subunit SecD
MHLKILFLFALTCATCHAQQTDLVEGFYEIVTSSTPGARKMYLVGDSSQVYFIAAEPIVSRQQLMETRVDPNTNALYFLYDEEGTKNLQEFTANHIGEKVAFVNLGALAAIRTVDEVVNNGIIALTSKPIYKVNLEP